MREPRRQLEVRAHNKALNHFRNLSINTTGSVMALIFGSAWGSGVMGTCTKSFTFNAGFAETRLMSDYQAAFKDYRSYTLLSVLGMAMERSLGLGLE